MAIIIFHWSLVRLWPFADTGRFLADLFTFLSWQPIVNWLRASRRNSCDDYHRGWGEGGGGGGEEEKGVFCPAFGEIAVLGEIGAGEQGGTSNVVGD